MSSPTKLRQMAKELGWPPELEKAADQLQKLKRENAELREAKDAYFKHNNILVQLMTEEQKKKALEILMSRPKEAQP